MSWSAVLGAITNRAGASKPKAPSAYQLCSYKVTGTKGGQTVNLFRFGPGPALDAKRRLVELGWEVKVTPEERKR
jgi:hypothetical protein